MIQNDYAFVIAASEGYLNGVTALLNSIKVHNKNTDVVLLSHKLPDSFLKSEVCSNVTQIVFCDLGHQQESTAFDRFKMAYEIGQKYKAICLLDADMFLTHNCDLFFNIASEGFIVTGSNGMLINFTKAYQEKYKVDLGCENYIYAKVHTTVPIFINKNNLDWFKVWYELPRIDSFDDFLLLNLVGIKLKKYENMLCMPPYTFTGIHHWQMKPETSVFERDGVLYSGTEEHIYMVHGKWWWTGWTQDLRPTMSKYFKDNECGGKQRQRTEYAINVLQKQFNKYLEYEG